MLDMEWLLINFMKRFLLNKVNGWKKIYVSKNKRNKAKIYIKKISINYLKTHFMEKKWKIFVIE